MRYLILSDLHANLEALESVVALAPPTRYDRVLVLGDVVGYGADPNAVVEWVRTLGPYLVIRGNHDKVAAGLEDAEGFNAAARQSAMWTSTQLSPSNRSYLAGLPAGPRGCDDIIQICHGAPYDEDAYVFEPDHALRALYETSMPLCFFGHTHVQIGYWASKEAFDMVVPDGSTEFRVVLQPNRKYLINPGSVGQPRDGDPRAGFAEYDSERRELVLRRTPYDVASAQNKISRAGLPEGLARRLGLGK